MSILGDIGKALSIGGAAVALPFTGGASAIPLAAALGLGGTVASTLGNAGQAAGPAAGSVAAGANSALNTENSNTQKAFEDALASEKATEGNLENRLQLGEQYQNNSYRNAMKSALAKNIQDVQLTGGNPRVPWVNFTGGLRPSAFGPEGRAAANAMYNQSMNELGQGQSPTELGSAPTVPGAPQFKTPGVGTNILGTIGAIGTAMNAASAGSKQDQYQQQLLAKVQAMLNKNNPNQPKVNWNFDQFGNPTDTSDPNSNPWNLGTDYSGSDGGDGQ